MDNMRSHYAKAVKQMLDNSRVDYLYLPSYSPDLNLIEKMWSKFKAVLRKEKTKIASELPSAISKGLFNNSSKGLCRVISFGQLYAIIYWIAINGQCVKYKNFRGRRREAEKWLHTVR